MAESGEVVMKTLKALLSRLVRLVMKPVRLVREGDADLDGTCPDHRRPDAEEIMVQGSVTTGFLGSGGMGGI